MLDGLCQLQDTVMAWMNTVLLVCFAGLYDARW